MTLARDPFERMERMLEQMRRSMWRLDPEDIPFAGPITPRLSGSDINLSLEVDEEGYVVFADLPGFEKNEIDLRFTDGVLTISASHDVRNGEDGRVMRHRSSRIFEELTIPGTVRTDEITASYRNGVLEVHLPTEEDVDDNSSRIEID